MEEKNKSITEIIEEVTEEICKHYCKYTDQAYEHLDQEEVFEKCEGCPLNRLH